MVENGTFIPGSVAWIDVTTADPVGTHAFYAGLFGWTYEIDRDPRRGGYASARLHDRPVAGIVGVPVPDGQPVTWTLYLTTANISHTAGLFGQWGGQVLFGPQVVPRQGSMLVGLDPTGVRIGFWQPGRPWTFRTHDPGTLVWAELNTRHGHRADEFYAQLFGYHQHQIGDGSQVDYTTWSLGGQTILGRLHMNDDWPDHLPPGWTLHFAVDPRSGTDGAVERVIELGGRVDVDPYDTELGRTARVRDSSGAAFALIDPTVRLYFPPDTAAGTARVDDPYDD